MAPWRGHHRAIDATLLRANAAAFAVAALADRTSLPLRYFASTARADITPDHPVRLSGYGSRREETSAVVQRLWARALVLASDRSAPHLLLAVDATGVPEELTEEVARRLRAKAGLGRERLALTVSHTHTAPALDGYLPTLFGRPIPAAHQENIRRYTRRLINALERIGLEALRSLEPVALTAARGTVKFAANRRTAGGPVDNDLPLLVARAGDGRIRAVVATYACHCTTFHGRDNFICGDWASYAQEMVEKAHPESTCLMTIGCGADANPTLRRNVEDARRHGREISTEVDRLLAARQLRPVRGPLEARFERLELPFEPAPGREEWRRRARKSSAVGYHARRQLARLDSGAGLDTKLRYPVATWCFGRDLGFVFLGGEVVVDYALRLKREFDRERLWIHAYANDVACYIPSRRILAEGGYEAEGAMTYYDQPTRLAPGVEDMIVNAVHRLMPRAFAAASSPAAPPAPAYPALPAARSQRLSAGL